MKVTSHMRWLLDSRRTHEKRVSRRLGDLTMIHPWWMEFTLIQCSQDGRLLVINANSNFPTIVQARERPIL